VRSQLPRHLVVALPVNTAHVNFNHVSRVRVYFVCVCEETAKVDRAGGQHNQAELWHPLSLTLTALSI